jgi:hypothetical protein
MASLLFLKLAKQILSAAHLPATLHHLLPVSSTHQHLETTEEALFLYLLFSVQTRHPQQMQMATLVSLATMYYISLCNKAWHAAWLTAFPALSHWHTGPSLLFDE